MTSIVAARKGQAELALGNALGSNLFNILLILGVATLLHPVSVNLASAWDLIILIGISVIAFVFSFTARSLSRVEGGIMVALYIADVIFAIFR